MKPQYPLYIPTKSRHDSRYTIKALQRMGVDFYAIVEEQQYNDYAAVISRDNILVLDKTFQETYDTFDELGNAKSKGPGPARNFAWAHALSNGYAWHWVMDDNIRCFYRLNNNLKIRCPDGALFRAMEDFCLRYTNIGMAGPNYTMFAKRKQKIPPFITNTRIYSCNFIRNDLPFRWRGRYNEDTDLSLRMLKSGWCTVQFNAFLQEKMTTQALKGGNTQEFYAEEGTMPKSRMQVRMHPDVSELVWKFGRWHHHVDYRHFKSMALIRDSAIEVAREINEYGLVLKTTG